MTTNWLKDLKQRSNSVKTFKSYVNLDSEESSKSSKDASSPTSTRDEEDDIFSPNDPYLEPSLLPGEAVISQAENVLKFNTFSELNKGISGLFLCTNFKLSFLTAESFSSNLHQRNILLGENDICLTNIDAVYHVNNGKRKKLSVSCANASIELIEIHCKDFRIYTFSFKFCPPHQRTVISAVVHHAFVPRINLLFAFDYKQASSFPEESENHSFLFTRRLDWEAELERCKCPGWRVTLVNEKFLLCDSLPESFVVPSILLDMNLNKCAPHFGGHRVPTWSWGLPSGASIIRMASLDSSISDSRQKDVMIDAISRASPQQLPVQTYDLDKLCPKYKEVQDSFLKLKELCMQNTPQEFTDSEANYLSRLDSTKWLQHVSACLNTAVEAASAVLENATVIFSEHEGRDLCAVLSSLVQIMLDPFYRTIAGFERLIQKEWIALGHPFTERHRLVSGSESEESPIFLLFLDCVWQLTEQCPTVFDFSETYLTTLWDSTHLNLFDTFLFSSHKCRTDAMGNNRDFAPRSVWLWSRQFSKSDIKLFSNPLSILNQYTTRAAAAKPVPFKHRRPKSLSCMKETCLSRVLMSKKHDINPIVWSEDEENVLKIDPFVKSLNLWHQCYLRWVPFSHVLGGGPATLFLTNLKICTEIRNLEGEIKSLTSPRRNSHQKHRRVASDDYTISTGGLDSSQVQEGSSVITSVFPFAPVAPFDWTTYQIYSFTPSLYSKVSYVEGQDWDD